MEQQQVPPPIAKAPPKSQHQRTRSVLKPVVQHKLEPLVANGVNVMRGSPMQPKERSATPMAVRGTAFSRLRNREVVDQVCSPKIIFQKCTDPNLNFSEAIKKEKDPKKLQMQTTDTEVTTPKVADTLAVSTCKGSPRVHLHVFGETPIVDRKFDRRRILQKLGKITKKEQKIPESTFII